MMKTICMYSTQVHLVGGVESVVRELHRMLPTAGYRVVLATEHGCPNWAKETDCLRLRALSDRASAWKAFAVEHKIDCVVFHFVDKFDAEAICGDIVVLNALGVTCIKMCHSTFVAPLLVSGDEESTMFDRRISALCDAVFTVSSVDALWWSALGFPSLAIRNPIAVPQREKGAAKVDASSVVVNILWAGRPIDVKQPEAALNVFARVCDQVGNVRLTMVGGIAKHWRPLRRVAKRLGIAGKVTMLTAQPDIADLWARADIHLLTSLTESSCLVLGEAKSYGIPSVVFDIPYNEYIREGKGLVVVPQGDEAGMAAALVKLVKDQAARMRLGQEALSETCDAQVIADWQKALSVVESKQGFVQASPELQTIVTQQQFAWEHYCKRNLEAVRLEENLHVLHLTARPVSKALAWFISFVRRLRG